MPVIPHEAVAYLADKKLKTAWNWSRIYAAEHNTAFTVAKIMEQDILDGIHRQIVRAVEDGQTFHSFKRDLINRLGQSGWGSYEEIDKKTGEIITRLSANRLRKIYETNVTQSYHAGAWQNIQETKKAYPYLRYRLGPSIEHRVQHKAWEGLVLPVDDPFWQTHMPMNGWGCKCDVEQLTKKEAQAIGISKSPKINYHNWKNPVTGRMHKVPKGIDPGFEYNVGMHRQQKHLSLLTDKIESVAAQSPDRAVNAVYRLVAGTIFQYWLEKPQGVFPVAMLAESTVKKMAAKTPMVRLSADTMLKQTQHHPELTVADYRNIFYSLTPELIIAQGNKNHALVVYYHERYYRIVFKTARDGSEVWLQSFSRISKPALKHLKNQQAKK